MNKPSARRSPPAVMTLALAAALLVIAMAAPLAAAGPELRAAPLNPAFLQSLVSPPVGVPSSAAGGHGFGGAPGPQDMSYTRGMQVPAPIELGSPPAAYDLRTLGRVTAVRDQGLLGTCWAFASLGSLESCLLPGETSDFSEDNLVLTSGFEHGGKAYDWGGGMHMSTAYLVRWGGPVYESEDAYGDSTTPTGLSPRRHVQEVYWIPLRGSALDNDNIKDAVMQYGGVDVSMSWPGSTKGDSSYNAATASYYYDGSSDNDHEVLVVGWDDNYPAANFATTPPGNGAFIVKNSWGTDWGNNGYCHVSYYDSKFGRGSHLSAVFAKAESTGNYTGIYQYDPLGQCTATGYSSSTGWFANVFSAQTTAALTAVGFYTLSPGTSYEVYTGPSLAAKTLRTSGKLPYMGYHTVTLPSAVGITSGQEFVVAVKVTSPGTTYNIALEAPIAGYSSGAVARAGQSYVSSTGSSWRDLATMSGFTNANVCLKAYTTGSGPTPTPTPTPTPGGDPDDDIPGVALPPSPFTGCVSSDSDLDDVYRVSLGAGQTLRAGITGPFQTDLRLYLYAPGTTSVKDPDTAYLAVAHGQYPASLSHTASATGTYYLDAYAYAGAGAYTVSYSISAPSDEDRVGPVCAARDVTVKRGRTCKLYFKVHDALSAQVSTTVSITTRSGAVKKRWRYGYGENYDGWWSLTYTCRLPKGTYRIVVTGEDLAGNKASKVGRATLTVK